ncbi:MAG: glycogen debranching protein [Acidobacteria bacterium]|nr:glycogen debranching protein [Acidobacteriota bacterium]
MGIASPGASTAPSLANELDAARQAAVQVLRDCSHAGGMNASAGKSGHCQVWARDSMITLLGACTLDDPPIRNALRATIAALGEHQSPSGCIPNNIDPVTGKVNFRAYADSGLWFVIGTSLLHPEYSRIQRVLNWYECQDVDLSGLISIQESSDWQDLFCTRGKGLYVNCLYVMALRRAAEIASRNSDGVTAERYSERAAVVKEQINQRLWYRGDGVMLRHVRDSFSTDNLLHDSLGRPRWLPAKRILVNEHYYLAYLAFRAVGEWFDCLGNLMAILSGVASPEQANAILDFVQRNGLAEFPLRAIYPPVTPTDPDWRGYYGQLNQQHHYHNGGVWPFIGGFYVAALVAAGRMDTAAAALRRLARLNQEGTFNEWHHGVTGVPMGVPSQAWSAGMYLYSYECVRAGQLLFL